MAPNTARLILWLTTAGLIGLTTVLTLTLGRYWSVSEVMGRVFDGTPILMALFQLVALWLFVQIMPDWGMADLLLAVIVWESIGHICWSLR